MTKMIYNYEELFEDQEDGTTILTIPVEICEDMGLNPGDPVIINVEDGKLYIKKQYGKK